MDPRRGRRPGIGRIAGGFARIAGGALAVAGLALVPAGCGPSVEGPTVALYPSPRLPRAQVVHLFGPLQSVDGRDVANLGDGIEVMPGCHVVWTRADAIEPTSTVSFSGKPPGRPFAIEMQPGFTYVFKRQVLSASMGSYVNILTTADELDAKGSSVRTLQPAKNPDELAACRAQAQST